MMLWTTSRVIIRVNKHLVVLTEMIMSCLMDDTGLALGILVLLITVFVFVFGLGGFKQ